MLREGERGLGDRARNRALTGRKSWGAVAASGGLGVDPIARRIAHRYAHVAAPVGTGDATGTCWQTFPDVPAATGPSGTAGVGACSLVGTWTYEVDFSHSKNYRTVWGFDDQGRMVGGPEGTNLCQGFTWHGNYTLDADRFAVTRVSGQGAPTCGRDFVSSLVASLQQRRRRVAKRPRDPAIPCQSESTIPPRK